MHIQGLLTFYKHASSIKEYTNMSYGRVIHILFYEQAVYERGKNNGKGLTWKVSGIKAMWLYFSLTESETTSLLFV